MWTWLFILCIALPLCARFLPSLCITLWLKLKGRSRDMEDLVYEIDDLKAQQSQVSMVDEFAKHAKLNRRINAKNNQLKSLSQNRTWITMKAYWYSKIGVYILSFVLFALYRYEPVLLFDISPLIDYKVVYVTAYILSFPTGMPGAVGLPVALFVCNRTVNQVLDLLVPKKSKQPMRDEPVE